MKRLILLAMLFLAFSARLQAQNSNSVTVTVIAPPTWTINVTPGSYYQSKATTMTINVTAGPVSTGCTATWDTTNLPLTFPASLTNPVAITAAVSTTMTATLGSHAVVVTCPVPVLTMNGPVQLPNAQVGAAYSASLQGATGLSGGIPPYSWSLISGSLPAGLSLSSSGNVTGTPSSAGSFDFGFTVTDSTGLVAHSGVLNWTASLGGSIPPTAVVGYNLYRGDQTGGPTRSSTVRS